MVAVVVALVAAIVAVNATRRRHDDYRVMRIAGVAVHVPAHLTDAQICAIDAGAAQLCSTDSAAVTPSMRAFFQEEAQSFVAENDPRVRAAKMRLGTGHISPPASVVIPAGVPMSDPIRIDGFTNTNAWLAPVKFLPHASVEVYAGYATADPQQGGVVEQAGGSPTLPNADAMLPTPTKHGPVTIVGSKGLVLLLKYRDGGYVHFDIVRGRFT
jgi:hypothetical protein